MELSTLLLTVALVPIITISTEEINPKKSEAESANQTLDEKLAQFHKESAYELQDKSANQFNKTANQLVYQFQLKPEYKFNQSAIHFGGPDLSKTMDTLVDYILEIGLYFVNSDYHIDSLSGDVTDNLLFIPANSHYDSKNIDIVDMKTFRRTGKTKVDVQNGTYEFQILLGFGKLLLTVEKLTLNFKSFVSLISLHGSVVGNVTNDSFLIDLEVVKTLDHCKVFLKSFKLVDFEYTIDMNLIYEDQTWYKKWFLNYLKKTFQTYFRGALETMVAGVLSNMVKENGGKICNF